jgi:hypothetical protein
MKKIIWYILKYFVATLMVLMYVIGTSFSMFLVYVCSFSLALQLVIGFLWISFIGIQLVDFEVENYKLNELIEGER